MCATGRSTTGREMSRTSFLRNVVSMQCTGVHGRQESRLMMSLVASICLWREAGTKYSSV